MVLAFAAVDVSAIVGVISVGVAAAATIYSAAVVLHYGMALYRWLRRAG